MQLFEARLLVQRVLRTTPDNVVPASAYERLGRESGALDSPKSIDTDIIGGDAVRPYPKAGQESGFCGPEKSIAPDARSACAGV